MEWKVYATRKDYEASDSGRMATHATLERGSLWDQAPQGVWALREGETVPVYVRKRPGKGKAFYYRIEGETAPREASKPKPKPKPKHMEPLFEV